MRGRLTGERRSANILRVVTKSVTHQRILKRNVKKAVIVCRNGKQKWRWKNGFLKEWFKKTEKKESYFNMREVNVVLPLSRFCKGNNSLSPDIKYMSMFL